jgi:hypothetical protein
MQLKSLADESAALLVWAGSMVRWRGLGDRRTDAKLSIEDYPKEDIWSQLSDTGLRGDVQAVAHSMQLPFAHFGESHHAA